MAFVGPGFAVLNPWAQILEAQPFDGLGFAVLDPWAQILEAQPLVGSGFAVLEPGFAMEKLPHETLGANPRSPICLQFE